MHRGQYGNPRGEELSGALHLVAWIAVEGSASALQKWIVNHHAIVPCNICIRQQFHTELKVVMQ
jgi:hypothetical protein